MSASEVDVSLGGPRSKVRAKNATLAPAIASQQIEYSKRADFAGAAACLDWSDGREAPETERSCRAKSRDQEKAHALLQSRPIVERRREGGLVHHRRVSAVLACPGRLASQVFDMQTVFADWASRTARLTASPRLETDEDELLESDGIPARGLEILQVLNDVFNTLPRQAGETVN
jgi:hypothetical protein